jgi:hypothetical protein
MKTQPFHIRRTLSKKSNLIWTNLKDKKNISDQWTLFIYYKIITNIKRSKKLCYKEELIVLLYFLRNYKLRKNLRKEKKEFGSKTIFLKIWTLHVVENNQIKSRAQNH